MSDDNLLHFPALTSLPEAPDPALLADISILEVAILATLWNYHPRPLRISEIYLAVRSAAGGKLEPCATATTYLAARGLVSDSGAPFFRYQLNHNGIFTALYFAIAGASNRFNVAHVASNEKKFPADTVPTNVSQIGVAASASVGVGQGNIACASTADIVTSILPRKDFAGATTTGLGRDAISRASTSAPVPRIFPDPLARLPIVKPASEVAFDYYHTGLNDFSS